VKELVRYIARALVEAPDEVEVEEGGQDDEGRKIIELRVAEPDRGKVIGKKGRMAHSMRTLISAATPADQPTTLEIID
jgi:predicted RNA-binding protein YlqC (UPF0109 family)